MPFLNLTVKSKGTIIPILGGIGYINYYGTEKWMTEILRILFALTKDCFVDVGVNLGQTLIKVRGIEKTVDYIGFEPNPNCIYYTEKLIKANDYINCNLVPVGISEKNEIVRLKFFDSHHLAEDPMASIIEDFREEAIAEKNIALINYDIASSVITKKIGIIKIDVEGAELYVIKGLSKIIEKDRPFLIVEILPAYSANIERPGRVIRQGELLKYLKDINYSVFSIIKNVDDTLNDFLYIEDFGRQTDYHFSDYLFIPSEKQMLLKSIQSKSD